jgi:hypothetical protein
MIQHRRPPVDAGYFGPGTKFESHQAKPTDGIKAGLRAFLSRRIIGRIG